METRKDLTVENGFQQIAKGAERLLVEVDAYLGKATLKPLYRPSTYVNIGFGLLGNVLVGTNRVKAPYDRGVAALAGHMLTKIWDYVEEYVPSTPTAGARLGNARAIPMVRTSATGLPGGSPQAVYSNGRYVVTG